MSVSLNFIVDNSKYLCMYLAVAAVLQKSEISGRSGVKLNQRGTIFSLNDTHHIITALLQKETYS